MSTLSPTVKEVPVTFRRNAERDPPIPQFPGSYYGFLRLFPAVLAVVRRQQNRMSLVKSRTVPKGAVLELVQIVDILTLLQSRVRMISRQSMVNRHDTQTPFALCSPVD